MRKNSGFRMRQECRDHFPATEFKGNRQLATPTCMSGSLTRRGGEPVPGIPGACATPQTCVSGKRPMVMGRIQWRRIIRRWCLDDERMINLLLFKQCAFCIFAVFDVYPTSQSSLFEDNTFHKSLNWVYWNDECKHLYLAQHMPST